MCVPCCGTLLAPADAAAVPGAGPACGVAGGGCPGGIGGAPMGGQPGNMAGAAAIKIKLIQVMLATFFSCRQQACQSLLTIELMQLQYFYYL